MTPHLATTSSHGYYCGMRRVRPNISKEEFARRGEQLFQHDIQSLVQGRDLDDFVAIDITTGQFEVGPDEMDVTDHLRARLPDAHIWLRRVGPRPVRYFGPQHSTGCKIAVL